MMHTMHTAGPSPMMGIFFGLHALGALACMFGLFFLAVYAVKALTPAQLKKWGMWLAIGGAIVCLLTIGAVGHSRMAFKMKGVDSAGAMMRNVKGMDMSMNGMTMMLEDKTGDAFDEAFLEMMIPHHQGAIDMAELVEKNAKHAELKAMAGAIISAQQEEIDRMEGWMKAWGYNQ